MSYFIFGTICFIAGTFIGVYCTVIYLKKLIDESRGGE